MSLTDFPNGVTSFGAPVTGYPGVFAIPPKASGRVRLVGSSEEFGTIANAVAQAHTGDVIVLTGPQDYNETGIQTPAGVNNVSIVGMGNVQRSVRWRDSTNTASPLIQVRGSGWTFRNIYFAGTTADYCISLLRDATYNSSESRILECIFNGGSGHIESDGGASNVIISGCRFINARGGTASTPGAIIGTSTAQAVPTNWEISYNRFYNCDKHVDCDMSRSMIFWNYFQATGQDGAATVVLRPKGPLGQGDYNVVAHNVLGVAGAVVYDNDATLKFQDGSNSIWVDNFANDASDYGLPG